MAPSNEARLRRISIPTPNKGLAEWLMSKECKAMVTEATMEIFSAYQNSLPVRTGNLRDGAYWTVGHGGWRGEQDRWFGWVGNRARSYRKTRGYLYGRFIEYGKPSRGIEGQHQLRNATHSVLSSMPGVSGVNAVAERSTRTGYFGRGNTAHRQLQRDARGRFVKRS